MVKDSVTDDDLCKLRELQEASAKAQKELYAFHRTLIVPLVNAIKLRKEKKSDAS